MLMLFERRTLNVELKKVENETVVTDIIQVILED